MQSTYLACAHARHCVISANLGEINGTPIPTFSHGGGEGETTASVSCGVMVIRNCTKCQNATPPSPFFGSVASHLTTLLAACWLRHLRFAIDGRRKAQEYSALPGMGMARRRDQKKKKHRAAGDRYGIEDFLFYFKVAFRRGEGAQSRASPAGGDAAGRGTGEHGIGRHVSLRGRTLMADRAVCLINF
ncbi:hypothetical protein BC826DRAFT_672279 [Russula brevipes]|nr:hypothetical protein BC826DRAFT_672279 [Russula brevipes]